MIGALSIAINADGTVLAIGTLNGVVVTLEIENKKIVHKIDAGRQPVHRILFINDKALITVHNTEKISKLWHLSNGLELACL